MSHKGYGTLDEALHAEKSAADSVGRTTSPDCEGVPLGSTGEITTLLEVLDTIEELLNRSIADLTLRISPVLRPAPTQLAKTTAVPTVRDPATTDCAHQTALGERLHSMGFRFQERVHEIQEITRAVEL